MIETIVDIEFSILNFLNSLHNPVLDNIMVFITRLGDMGILWILTGLIMCFTKKYRRAGVTVIVALLLTLVIGNFVMKPFFGRLRPFEHLQTAKLLIPEPSGFSFPSGHTFSSFSVAMVIFHYHQKEGLIAILAATLIAFSRLYLYVHFPTDVFFGLIFGIMVSYISKAITDKCKLFAF